MPLTWLALSSLGLSRTVSQNFKARSCKCQFNGTSSGLCQLCFCARPLTLRVLIFTQAYERVATILRPEGNHTMG